MVAASVDRQPTLVGLACGLADTWRCIHKFARTVAMACDDDNIASIVSDIIIVLLGTSLAMHKIRPVATDEAAWSVSLSACLFVTFMSPAKMVKPIEIPFW